MLTQVSQYVPSKVCLSCDGCCRFKEPKSPWRPKIAQEEKARFLQLGLAERILSKRTVDASGHLTTLACGGMHLCTFFNPEDHTCSIYHFRPFECQLYPFVLTRDKKKTIVSVHLLCPFIQKTRQDKEFQDYTDYLKEFFQHKEVISFLKKNPSLIGDYSAYKDELEELFALSLE